LAAGLLFLAAGPAAAQTAPRTFTAAGHAQLISALKAARAGDTVLLEPGNYGNFSLWNYRYPGGAVTIRSADPENRARFGQMKLSQVQGITISGVDAQSSLSPVVSLSGSDLKFVGNRIRGANPNQNPLDDDQTGMWVRSSTRVLVGSNDFQDLRAGIWVQRTPNVAVRHNSFIHLREGINMSGTAYADISHNRFEKFQPRYNAGEHPDAIQFWNTNETVGNSHVTIRNNFLSFGHDGHVQGIFLGTEDPNMPHHHIEISGNIYYGSSQHGISLSAVNDARVFNNIVAATPWSDRNNTSLRSEDGLMGGGTQPYIRMGTGTRVSVTRNIAMHFNGMGPGRHYSDNIDIWDTHWKRGDSWASVLPARPTSRLPALSEFVTLSPSLAASRNIGVTAPFQAGFVTLDPVAALAYAARQPLP
ncbi:MAG: NosD domain-containing protein, partial [Sandaracinobacteroides sp.]